MAFLENTDYYDNWDDMSANDQYLSSLDKYMYNTSDTVWNNAAGRGTLVPRGVVGKKARPCKVTVTQGNPPVTDVCHGYIRRGKCRPCHKMQGVGMLSEDLSREFSGSYSNASGSVMATTPQSGGHYTQAEGDSKCAAAFGGGSTMSHYNCVQNPQHSAAYDCTIYCNSTVPGQPPMALETVIDTSPVRGRGPRKGVDRYRNASGCGYSNAAGGPVINVGGDTYDMQPTLAWNQGDFFGQTQGFGAGNLVCEPCPPRFRGTRQACGGTGCYNRLGQRLAESGTGIPPGMSVQYTQV